MYDSVQVFAVGLRTLEQSHALRPANISCELEHPWDGGLSLTNYINSVSLFSLALLYILTRKGGLHNVILEISSASYQAV